MSNAATHTVSERARQQRHLKNFLLDRRFQLKYAGYLMLIAVVLSVSLGVILWRTGQQVVLQSQKNVEQGEKVVTLGREVVAESRKVSDVVQMNIVKDPVYSDNPALLDAFKRDSEAQDARLKSQQARLVQQSRSLKQQSAALVSFQRQMLITLCAVLSLLVVLIGLAGIVVTHKIAGPIFKMKRQIREVGEGNLRVPTKLRKGDELVDFFRAFETMVVNLRRRQTEEIEKLDWAIARVEGKATDDDLAPLRQLRRDMQAALDT